MVTWYLNQSFNTHDLSKFILNWKYNLAERGEKKTHTLTFSVCTKFISLTESLWSWKRSVCSQIIPYGLFYSICTFKHNKWRGHSSKWQKERQHCCFCLLIGLWSERVKLKSQMFWLVMHSGNFSQTFYVPQRLLKEKASASWQQMVMDLSWENKNPLRRCKAHTHTHVFSEGPFSNTTAKWSTHAGYSGHAGATNVREKNLCFMSPLTYTAA